MFKKIRFCESMSVRHNEDKKNVKTNKDDMSTKIKGKVSKTKCRLISNVWYIVYQKVVYVYDLMLKYTVSLISSLDESTFV